MVLVAGLSAWRPVEFGGFGVWRRVKGAAPAAPGEARLRSPAQVRAALKASSPSSFDEGKRPLPDSAPASPGQDAVKRPRRLVPVAAHQTVQYAQASVDLLICCFVLLSLAEEGVTIR